MHVGMRGTIAALTILVASGLAGCSNGGANIGNLLQGDSASSQTTTTALKAPTSSVASRGKIAIAPVIGAPDQIAKQIVAQLGAETAKNQIGIAKTAGEQVDYTLRGYIVAARESTGTKVSYIWDVTNPKGARVHRITGEEVVKGAGAGDPWASVSPQLIQVIAAKTGEQLNTWMPQKAKPTAAAVPVAQKPLLAPTKKVAGATATAATKVAAATNTAAGARSGLQPTPVVPPRSTASTTGSIRKAGPVTALVPQVVGAPGDGSRSLASALRNELLRNGIKPSPPGTPAYRVEGKVKVGPVENGQQPIRIDWVVRDPKGANLGTVSQENKIPGGSLNGQWGQTASAAATAATQGILKLLPKRTASR
ncbi:MAG: hypothetical protein JXQ99_10620 [Hyphomicrobiaceae bacterium]